MPRARLALAVLVLAACETEVSFVRLNRVSRETPARDPRTVVVFAAGRPDRPFVDLGIIEVQEAMEGMEDRASLVALMRAEAGARGCDGLVLLGANDETVVRGGGGGIAGMPVQVSSSTKLGMRGSCVVFTDPPATPPAK